MFINFDESPNDIFSFDKPTSVTVMHYCGHIQVYTVVGDFTSKTRQWCDRCITPQKIRVMVVKEGK